MRPAPSTRRAALVPVAVLTALGLVLTGCSADRPAARVALEDAAPVSPAAPLPTAPVLPVPTAAAPTAPTAAPTRTAPLPPPYDVKAVQRSLAAQRYYIGAVDGERGPALRSAVMAFQKVNGLGADGVVGKGTLAALKAPRTPALRGGSGPADRVEVDLSKQVLYVVKGGRVSRILPVSSGNGERYAQKDGGRATALTPTGWFKVQRRIVGERVADLGTLYDPQYFYKGWAIHGSNSVPAYPASHGCVRVTRRDAIWLLGQIDIGTAIYLYGGRHTFTAGSSAPGTDNPSGDTPGEVEPTSSPTPPPARPAPSASPSRPPASPRPTASPSSSPTPSPAG